MNKFNEKIITQNGLYKATEENLKGYHKLTVDVQETTGLPAEIGNEVVEIQPLEEVCNVNESIQHIFPNPFVDSYNASKSQAYLQSTGTQYIDTGVIPTNHRVKMKFQCTTNDYGVIFGSYGDKSDENNYNVYELVWYKGKWYFAPNYSNGSQSNFSPTVYPSDVIELDFNTYDNKIIMNGTVVADTYGTSNAVLPLYLFVQSGNMTSFSKMKLWYAQIYDRDTQELVRDFVPAVDENNVICLYDKVTKTYFYNQGSGEFTFDYVYDKAVQANVGESIAPITNLTYPDAQFNYQWQRGDNPQIYLETTGDGAYINTTILPNQDYKVEMLFRHMNNINSYEIPFGSRTSSTSNCFAYFQRTNNVMTSKTLSYNNGETVVTNMPTFYKVITKLTMDGNYLELQSDNEYKDIARPYGTFTCSVPLTIFGCNTNGTVQYFTPMQLFYFKIWNELDELVADYVPVLSTEEGHTNEPCLYDNVSQTYFYNAGTSNFNIGYQSLSYTDIEGETNNTYTATEDDINKCIKCKLAGTGNCKDQNIESLNVLIIEGDDE